MGTATVCERSAQIPAKNSLHMNESIFHSTMICDLRPLIGEVDTRFDIPGMQQQGGYNGMAILFRATSCGLGYRATRSNSVTGRMHLESL
jgi:hypothetical protein